MIKHAFITPLQLARASAKWRKDQHQGVSLAGCGHFRTVCRILCRAARYTRNGPRCLRISRVLWTPSHRQGPPPRRWHRSRGTLSCLRAAPSPRVLGSEVPAATLRQLLGCEVPAAGTQGYRVADAEQSGYRGGIAGRRARPRSGAAACATLHCGALLWWHRPCPPSTGSVRCRVSGENWVRTFLRGAL